MADAKIAPTPGNVKDISGERFGRLIVIGYGQKINRAHKWVCRCDCSNIVLRRADHMRSGRSSSCGCFNAEVQKESFKTHGGAALDKSKRHPLYSVWCGMKKRCYAEKCDAYPYYGGRGIGVSEAWRNDFSAFVRDMGARPDGTTLDRLDNDKDYGPGNCRWADKSTQMKNRRPFKRARPSSMVAGSETYQPHQGRSAGNREGAVPQVVR